MIAQLLSNTARIFSGYNASTTSILPVLSSIIHRSAYSSNFQRVRLPPKIRKTLEKVMGPRPKQPLPPFVRFAEQIRPQSLAEQPHLQKDLLKISSEKWKSLEAEEKAKFSEEYRTDMQKYLEEISNYNSKMTVNDLRRVQMEFDKDADSDLIKLARRLARQLNKPKRPPCSFLRFLYAKFDRRSDETHKEFVKRRSSTWNDLSETERKKYKTKPKEMKNYKKAMLEWEANVQRSVTIRDDGSLFLKPNLNDDPHHQENDEEDEKKSF